MGYVDYNAFWNQGDILDTFASDDLISLLHDPYFDMYEESELDKDLFFEELKRLRRRMSEKKWTPVITFQELQRLYQTESYFERMASREYENYVNFMWEHNADDLRTRKINVLNFGEWLQKNLREEPDKDVRILYDIYTKIRERKIVFQYIETEFEEVDKAEKIAQKFRKERKPHIFIYTTVPTFVEEISVEKKLGEPHKGFLSKIKDNKYRLTLPSNCIGLGPDFKIVPPREDGGNFMNQQALDNIIVTEIHPAFQLRFLS